MKRTQRFIETFNAHFGPPFLPLGVAHAEAIDDEPHYVRIIIANRDMDVLIGRDETGEVFCIGSSTVVDEDAVVSVTLPVQTRLRKPAADST